MPDRMHTDPPRQVFRRRRPRRRRALLAGAGLLAVLLAVLALSALLPRRTADPTPAATPSAAPTATPAAESPAPTAAPVPLPFSDTIDACVTGDGLFFTWDGGATASQALTADDCARYGITDTSDLAPLVLRWDVAAFLTEEDGQVFTHTSRDQGASWQVDLLADCTGITLTDRCLGFTGPGTGYAALSGTGADGAPWAALYTGLHHGQGWSAIPVPQAADGVVRPVNGLEFYDGASGVATAPGDDGGPWPRVFATMDGGQTWKEINVPFAESGQTGAERVSALNYSGTDWEITFTQAPGGTRELVYTTAFLTNNDWALASVHDAG